MIHVLLLLALLAGFLSAGPDAKAEPARYYAADYLHDIEGGQTVAEAIAGAGRAWRSGTAPSGHLEGALWVRYRAAALADEAPVVVTMGDWWVDSVSAYLVGSSGGVVRRLAAVAEPGFYTPHAFRLPTDLAPGTQLVFRLASETAIRPQLSSFSPTAFVKLLEQRRLLAVGALGGMGVCALFLAIAAIVLRAPSAAWLALATVGLQAYVILDAGALPGSWLVQLHGDFAVWNPLYMLPVVIAMLGMLRTAFPLAQHYPWLERVCLGGQGLLITCWVAGLAGGGRWLLVITNVSVLGVLLVILLTFALLIKRGQKWAGLGLCSALPLGLVALLRSPLLFTERSVGGWDQVQQLLPFATVLLCIALLLSRFLTEIDERRRIGRDLASVEADARRKLEREVRRRTLEAERARLAAEKLARVKDRFMVAVSHDLRTPLATIVGVVELLESGADDLSADRQRGMLRRASRYILDVIEDLTLYERLKSGSQRPSSNQFSLVGIAEDIEGLLGERAADNGVLLSIDIPPGLPDVVCDRRYVSRILVNLTTNALAATSSGGAVQLDLALRQGETGRELMMTVADAGRGLAPEALAALRSGDVAGYGFTVVGDLVNALQGRLSVDSELGKGTTVIVTIPVEIATASEDLDPANALLEVQRVLLVEDVPENQLIGSAMLRSFGLQVVAVASLRETREALAEGSYDVLLLDRQLPDGDGLAALEELRALCRSRFYYPRCVLVTADSSAEARDSALNNGFDSLLLKPYTLRQLRDALAGGSGRLPDVPAVGHRNYLDLLAPEQRRQVLQGFKATAGEVQDALRLALKYDDVELALSASHRLVGSASAAARERLAEQARAVNDHLRRDHRLDRHGLEQLLYRLAASVEGVAVEQAAL
ncbi:hypothetical protein HRUBRA_00185 [Pseudohaliea rubra DSM 19751]|uniref:histidine kinase n=2 Tax=Pseudohaliea TaxID=1341120 RepID=A0A095VV60_9GAMM|nr:hypothetical protein HRUBRA_00185 [Pseudohaliea rubra DSM 19751]